MLRGAETERELEMPDRESATSTNRVLDIIFSGILAVMVLVFAIQAAGYRAESARAPFVAMVPLGILVVLKLVRMSRASSISRIKSQTIEQVGEGHTQLKKLMLFILWLVLCVAAIYFVGHYAGVMLFLVSFLRIMSKERWRLIISLSAGMTGVIYVLCEMLLGIHLYCGVVYMLWRGYQIF